MLSDKWCKEKNEQYISKSVNDGNVKQMPLAVFECGSYKIAKPITVSKTADEFSVLEYVESGEAHIKIGDISYDVKKGDLYCIERGTQISITPNENLPLKLNYVLFNGTLFKNLLFSYNIKNTVMFKGYGEVKFFKRLADLFNLSKSKTDIYYLCCKIFSEIAFNIFLNCNDISESLSAEKILLRINNSIYKKGFNLEDIAKDLNISKAYLINLFKKAYGITPYKYFLKLKINAATELLMDKSKSVLEISEYLNFADQHYFSDVFKKSIGITPTEYRKIYSATESKDNLIKNINSSNRQVNIDKYIKQTWSKCIIKQTNNDGGVIGVPYPFIVPSSNDGYRGMYYWHTYFSNLGLIEDGLVIQAKYNASNIQYLIEKFDFMPNGNADRYTTRSQPPFFSQMVRDIYAKTGDLEWLGEMYKTLVKEYNWWQTNRMTPIGLNKYGIDITADNSEYEGMYKSYFQRTGIDRSSYDKHETVKIMGAWCESGWDCNPRMGTDNLNYSWIDLNSLLFMYENNFIYFSNQLNNGDVEKWQELRFARREKINKFMWNGEYYTDYCFETGKFSKVISCASFYPLYVGIASKEQALKSRKLLKYLEYPHGVVACAQGSREGRFQWDYPNAWAPLQYIVVKGLLWYNFFDDALRIAEKFVATVERNYIATGRLWEKYNAVTGGIDVKNENPTMSEILGWSAGVYKEFKKIIKKYKDRKSV